jgi:uncharacterized coiled-coil protein SlyX
MPRVNIRRLWPAFPTASAAEVDQLRRQVAEQRQQLETLSRVCLERKIEIVRLQQELESLRNRRGAQEQGGGGSAGGGPADDPVQRRFAGPSIGAIPLGPRPATDAPG